MIEIPSSLVDVVAKLQRINSRAPGKDVLRSDFDTFISIMGELGREEEALKNSLTEAEVSEVRSFCYTIRQEVARLRQEADDLERQLRSIRALCKHQGDQGDDCGHCGHPAESQFD